MPCMTNLPIIVSQIKQHERVEDSKNATKIKLQNEVKVSDNYKQYRPELTKALSKFESIWDGHLG